MVGSVVIVSNQQYSWINNIVSEHRQVMYENGGGKTRNRRQEARSKKQEQMTSD
jgi:hypothetical protein